MSELQDALDAYDEQSMAWNYDEIIVDAARRYANPDYAKAWFESALGGIWNEADLTVAINIALGITTKDDK